MIVYVLVYNISTYVLLHWCFCFEEFFLTITYYYYYFATVDASWKKNPNKQTNSPILVYDRSHYFGLGPKPKSKLADTFGQYRNQYGNQISKEESSYQ